jgi:hypothetical protein
LRVSSFLFVWPWIHRYPNQPPIIWPNNRSKPTLVVRPPPPPPGRSKSSNTLGVALGSVLGALSLIVLVLVFFLVRQRRRQEKEKEPYDFKNELQAIDAQFRTAPREMDAHCLKIISAIGTGSFGTVYKALLQDPTFGSSGEK